MENLFIIYDNEDIYLAKAESAQEAIDITYKENIEPFIIHKPGYTFTKKSDLKVRPIDKVLGTRKSTCLT